MKLLKYFADKGGADSTHRGPLYWPGTAAGFPVRGAPPPDLRGEEHLATPHVLDYHTARFKLWFEEDFNLFVEIMDRIQNGWYKELKRVDHWQETEQSYLVWLEWVQIYGEYAEQKSPQLVGSKNDPATQNPEDPRWLGTGMLAGIPLVADDFPDGQVV